LKIGGREASFGPYQLYIGGGAGNDYQNQTGRDLITDNTREGITNQIRFALDYAISQNSWRAWYGYDNAYSTSGRDNRGRPINESEYRRGLAGATPARNWN